jgi:hypothetical protein
MFSPEGFTARIFDNNADFGDLACTLFRHQYEDNSLYRRYVELLGIDPATVTRWSRIPFLPISFFKTHQVKTGAFTPRLVFESSRTTGAAPSRHLVADPSLYERSFREAFRLFYGPPEDYVILGLLPGYLERRHASLVYMVNGLNGLSGRPENGFYLREHARLSELLGELERRGQKTLLIGVTFALLDFAEACPQRLSRTVIMETGGMKGRREEWTRDQVHAFLCERLGVETVHSEYGMTELLSQAYSSGGGLYRCPPWMKVVLREETDPLELVAPPAESGTARGLINVIDLANIHSCAFIATDDIGRLHGDGSFEVLGRRDHSEMRGCSLLTA